MAISFEQVLVFHQIIQSGSFKAAAAQLHKTQPAISLSIKKLEEEMEVELFDRSGYRPELTEHGKSFSERSMKVLQGMGELEGLSKSFRKKEEPEIHVAIDGISPLHKLLYLFKNFGEKYPNTKLHLGFEILSDAERKLLSREAQIAVTSFISEPDLIEGHSVTKMKMIPVMSRELYKERKVKSEKDLIDIEQIVIIDKNGPKGSSFGLLENGKKWRLKDQNFKREIILAGLGWGHLAQHTIERELAEKKLVILDFENIRPRELDIKLVRLKKHNLGVVGLALWNELVSFKESKE
jgi:DNA-binding transcriptional LysR family regulator